MAINQRALNLKKKKKNPHKVKYIAEFVNKFLIEKIREIKFHIC